MPEGMTLLDVVNKDQVPLPTDSEAIAMKIIAAADRLKSCTPKTVQDFDDAMNIFGKLFTKMATSRTRKRLRRPSSRWPSTASSRGGDGRRAKGFEWKVFLKID